MAAEVTALQPLKAPPGPSPITPEQRYWRSFRQQQLIPSPHSNPITHVSHAAGYSNATASAHPAVELFAVTSGTRIQVFSSRTRSLVKTITRVGVDDLAHSGEIRRDGRVLVAGGDSGVLQVFDINSRAILKTWREHKQPVWCSKWSGHDATALMSASDDRTVRLWDLPSDASTTQFTGHQDYVRSGAFMPGQSGNLLVSGSYDQTVRLWDPRAAADRSVMTFKHAAPIESVLPMPSGTTLLASADNAISVLDLVAARPLQVLKSHHQKTVTSLSLASHGTRVVSGALDGHVKVFDTASWTVTAGSKYPSPILSLSVIPSGSRREDRHLAVGLQSGVMSLKTRVAGAEKATQRQKQKEMQALAEGRIEEYDRTRARKRGRTQGERIRLRGIDYDGRDADLIVEGNERSTRKKPPPWDSALRNAYYAKALDLAMQGRDGRRQKRQRPLTNANNPDQNDDGAADANKPQQEPSLDTNTMLTLLRALEHRSALRTALAGRDEASLAPLLRWLHAAVQDPRHVELTTRVASVVLELYGEHVGGDLGSASTGRAAAAAGHGHGSGLTRAVYLGRDSDGVKRRDFVDQALQRGGKGAADGDGDDDNDGERRNLPTAPRGGFTHLVEKLHAQVRRQVEHAQTAEAARGMLEMILNSG